MQDYTTKGNPTHIYKAAMHHPFPDWVAEKPMPTGADFEKAASAAFADPARRLLPLTTPEATFHSAIDLFANIEHYGADVFDRVKAAAATFGIEYDIAPYAGMFADVLEKSAAEPEDDGRYAINSIIGDVTFKLLPMNTADDVIESGRELAKMAAEHRIHYLTLLPAARELVKAASELGIADMPKSVWRLGAERCEDLEGAAKLLADRHHLSKSAQVNVLKDMYSEALTEAVTGQCTAYELVEKIAGIDAAAGMHYRYNTLHTAPLPHEVVFNGPLMSEVEKVAKANALIGTVLVPVAAIRAVPNEDFEFKLSKSAHAGLVDSLSSSDAAAALTYTVSTWSDTDRRTLLRIASAQ